MKVSVLCKPGVVHPPCRVDTQESSQFEPVEFDLATGNRVRVSARHFWEMMTESDRVLGCTPRRYFAIRIYSDEDTFPRRLIFCDEFRLEKEFEVHGLLKAWSWLAEMLASRAHLEFDDLDEFMEEFAEVLDRSTTEGEDCSEHITHFPATVDADREAFDPEDDCFYNDQRD